MHQARLAVISRHLGPPNIQSGTEVANRPRQGPERAETKERKDLAVFGECDTTYCHSSTVNLVASTTVQGSGPVRSERFSASLRMCVSGPRRPAAEEIGVRVAGHNFYFERRFSLAHCHPTLPLLPWLRHLALTTSSFSFSTCLSVRFGCAQLASAWLRL